MIRIVGQTIFSSLRKYTGFKILHVTPNDLDRQPPLGLDNKKTIGKNEVVYECRHRRRGVERRIWL